MKGKGAKLVTTAFLLCLSFATISVQAEPSETIVNNGNSENRLDIAILGDGYTQGELQKYKNDAQNMVQGFFAQQPFLEYQRYFNVHRIDVSSAQSGADHPERSFFVDTAFDATYNCSGIQRLICVSFTKVNNVAANSLSPTQRDLIFVIVNDSEFGGSGGSIAVASTNASAIEILLHEEGHSLGLLTDEFEGPGPPNCDNSTEPPAANATRETERALIKWTPWIDPNTPLPTNTSNPAVPGLYQGANYCASGLYRPTFSSKMRLLGFPFEQINSEQLIKRIYNFVSPLDSRLPVSSNLTVTQGQIQNFSVSTPAPLSHNLTVIWFVDGLQQASGPAFSFNPNNLSVGGHTLSAMVSDTTPFVRSDPDQLLNTGTSWSINVITASSIQLDAASYSNSESDVRVNVTVNRGGDTSAAAAVDYTTSDMAGLATCNSLNSGVASSRCDYATAIGRLRFAAGEISKTISVLVVDDGYGEGNETFNVTLSNAVGASLGAPSTATVTINDNEIVNGENPLNQAGFFAREHYVDFFSREPDASGLAFWTNQITSCGTDTACIELRRINVSAAFFLSIEFQQTGYLVYRMYKAYGNLPGAPVPVRFNEFLPDTQQIGQGVVVGQAGWEQVLENNKNAFAADFVLRSRFITVYPTTLTPANFVGRFFTNAEFQPSAIEQQSIIDEFGGAANTIDTAARSRALRRMAEHATLAQQEFNKAFVLMQYFGYLRRNPNDLPEPGLNFDGYNFWLGKLNQFDGNFVNAEMVKAFILSGEYKQRFGP